MCIGNRLGFINTSGERICPMICDEVWYFENEIAAVCRNGKWSIIK